MTSVFITLKCLLILFIILLLSLILILFIPFNYLFLGNLNKNIELNGEIKWLLGFIKISAKFKDYKLKFILTICNINFDISNLANRKTSPKNKDSKHETRHSLSNSIDTFATYYNNFKKIFTIVKPTSYSISGYLGFDDSSLTGKFTAILYTFIHDSNINIVPIFDEEIIDIKAKIIGNLKVYLICYVLIKSYFKNKFSKISKKEKVIKKKECIN